MSGYKLNILGFLVHIAHKTIKNIISLHKKRQKGSGSCLVFYHTYRHLHSIKSQSSSDSLSEIFSNQSFLFVITSETVWVSDWFSDFVSFKDRLIFFRPVLEWYKQLLGVIPLLYTGSPSKWKIFAYRVNECFLMVRRGHNRVQIKLPRSFLFI